MKDASGSVIYVGKAKNLRNRLRSYFSPNPTGTEKVLAMISHIADFEYVVVNSELEALLLEANFIKRYMPHYNILLRDDKGFPYICITMQEQYPRIVKVFRVGKDRDKGARYYGPFLGGDVFRAMEALREIFPTKTCKRVLPRDIGKQRPCLNYHIGQCVAPCRGDVSADEYRAVMESVCRFFEGRYDGLQKDLAEKMQQASADMDFEKAAVYRDRLKALQKIMESQKITFRAEKDMDAIGLFRDAGEICLRKMELRGGRIVGSSTYFIPDDGENDAGVLSAFLVQYYPEAAYVPPEILLPVLPDDTQAVSEYLRNFAKRKVTVRVPRRGDSARLLDLATRNAAESLRRRILRVGNSAQGIAEALNGLKEYLDLAQLPERIEAYDISNMGGDDKCGGMVVFRNGRPDRSGYRLFRLKTIEGQDDYASMREVLQRRFAHQDEAEFATLPDLVLMDGGRSHVFLAQRILSEFDLSHRICVAGMVKDARHRTAGLVRSDGTTIDLSQGAKMSEENLVVLRLLTGIQNEVHRFAFSYQRKLSKKRHLSFRLESIDGIGPAKRKALLSHFGTIGKVAASEVNELIAVSGISEANAQAVYEHFHSGKE